MKKALFLILILLTFNLQIIGILGATDEGYGEDETCLGQFVDSFENLNNVSVMYQVERNATLNAMELNYTVGHYYGSFDQYLEVYINSSRINEVLTDFPVLIILNGSAGINDFNSSIVFDEVGDSYQKIAITNSSFLDERYVEIEYWNASERIAWIWTHGVFSNVVDTLLLLHYDFDVINNTLFVDVPGSAVASNVWDSNFECVLHLSETAGNFQDSTSNNYDASAQGTVNRGTQIIDGGIDLPGTNDYVRIDTAGILDGLDEATIETWINIDVLGVHRSLVSDWGAGQDVVILYASTDTNQYRFLWRNTGAEVPNALFGAVNVGSWEYVATKYVRNDFAYGYENAIEVLSGAVGNFPLTSPNNLLYVGINRDLGFDQNGKMDEVRISSIARSQPWINATYYSSLDDFVNQGIGTGDIYVSDGYFTTDDYMNDTLCNGTALGLMLNTSIPANTDIQVQFSNDNVTWGDWEGIPLDSNILVGGFETIDLRYLNETDVYLRFNLSTTNPSVTPRIYQTRLISTIGAGAVAGPSGGGVGFIMIILICSPIIVLLVWRTRKR